MSALSSNSHHHAVKNRPKQRTTWLVRVSVLCIVVCALWFVWSVLACVFFAWSARDARQQISSVQRAFIQKDFAQAEQHLALAQKDFQHMDQAWNAIRPWRYVWWVGPRLDALRTVEQTGSLAVNAGYTMLQVVNELSQAAQLLNQGQGLIGSVQVPANGSLQQLSSDERRVFLQRLSDALPAMQQAELLLQQAVNTWQQGPRDPAFAATIQPWMMRLQDAERVLHQAIPLLQTFVPMAGYPHPKTYLVVLQNSDELRPTGGFIGMVGLVGLDAGRLVSWQFQDVYSLDEAAKGSIHDLPPVPLQRELQLQTWFLRDSNWSPDFPQTAERLLDIYQRERVAAHQPVQPIDGVIALEPGLFQQLLSLTGPLTVDGETFSANTFFSQLQYDVEVKFRAQGQSMAARKDIVRDVGQVLLQRLMEMPFGRWTDMLAMCTQALDHKDVLLYDRDPQLLAALDAKAWTDRIANPAQDYLWVVDTNVDAYKTDGVMNKQMIYQLDASDPNHPLATLRLHYQNTQQTADWRYTTYRDYVRVFVPEGSQLVSVQGAMISDREHPTPTSPTIDVGHDLGKTVFGTFWKIEPGQSRDLVFTYRLPWVLSPVVQLQQGSRTPYQLMVQKQPGSRMRLTLDISFATKIVSALPSEMPSEWGDRFYRTSTDVSTDKPFTMEIAP